MMRNSSLLLILMLFCLSCSNDDGQNAAVVVNNPAVPGDGQYFHLKVNGYDLPFDLSNTYSINTVSIYRHGTEFQMRMRLQPGNNLNVNFDENGKVISARYMVESISGTGVDYMNYPDFPGNYFNFRVISHDTINHRIKASFSGKLYLAETNLNSETFDIDACEFDLAYPVQNSGIYPTMFIQGFLDNCSAKFNGNAWYATRENYGRFTTTDPYKLEIKLATDTSPGSFNFSPGSVTNCIRLSKFNIQTLTYDYYDTSGSVAYTFREWHGLTYYTYMGSFSFTAVNPMDPADVIQVTDGKYTCCMQ